MENYIISSHRIRVLLGTIFLIVAFIPIVMLLYINEKHDLQTINSHHAQISATYINNLLNGYSHLLSNATIWYLTAKQEQRDLLATFIKKRLNSESAVINIAIFDLAGKKIYSTNPNRSIDISAQIQDITKSKLWISEPFFENNKWILQFCKYVKDVNQKPLGISVATIDLNTISKQFAQLPIGDHSTLSLVSQSGIYLARSPFEPSIIGANMLKMERTKADLSNAGCVIFPKSTIGNERYASIAPIFAFNLAIVSTLSTNSLFLELKDSLLLLALMFVAMELVMITASIKIKESQIEKNAAEKQKQLEIKQSEERFRTITSLTRELIFEFYRDRKAIYFSGSCKNITGLPCSELNNLKVKNLWSMVHKDDKKEVLRFFTKHKEYSCITYRVAHRDGGFIRVKMYGGYQNSNKLIGFIRDSADCRMNEVEIQTKSKDA